MHCTTTSHVWLWTGSGTSEGIPDHLPCQCHRYTAGEWYSLRAENARLQALLAERDAEIALLVAAGNKMHEGGKALRTYVVRDKTKNLKGAAWGDNLEFGLEASTTLCEGMEQWRAALAARGAQR